MSFKGSAAIDHGLELLLQYDSMWQIVDLFLFVFACVGAMTVYMKYYNEFVDVM